MADRKQLDERFRISDDQAYSELFPLTWTLVQTIDAAALATTVFPPGFLWSANWQSPTFDLHPELGKGTGPSINVKSIYNKSARLYVELRSNQAAVLNANNLNVRATDFVDTTSNEGGAGSGLRRLSIASVSSKFVAIAPANSAMAAFAPPGTAAGFGEGHPIRFWRLLLGFRILVETGLPLPAQQQPPTIGLQAALY